MFSPAGRGPPPPPPPMTLGGCQGPPGACPSPTLCSQPPQPRGQILRREIENLEMYLFWREGVGIFLGWKGKFGVFLKLNIFGSISAFQTLFPVPACPFFWGGLTPMFGHAPAGGEALPLWRRAPPLENRPSPLSLAPPPCTSPTPRVGAAGIGSAPRVGLPLGVASSSEATPAFAVPTPWAASSNKIPHPLKAQPPALVLPMRLPLLLPAPPL